MISTVLAWLLLVFGMAFWLVLLAPLVIRWSHHVCFPLFLARLKVRFDIYINDLLERLSDG